MAEGRKNEQDDCEDMKKTFTYLLASLLCLCGCKENDHIDYTLNDRVYFYETEQTVSRSSPRRSCKTR